MRQKNGFLTLMMYIILVFLIVGLAVILFLNVMANEDLAQQRREEIAASFMPATPAPTATPEPTPTPVRNTEDIVLAFAGDVVGQVGLTSDVREEVEDDSGEDDEEESAPVYRYDYSEQIGQIRPLIENADLASCTLASTLMDAAEYDSYLMPTVFAGALADCGFDLVNTATEHILDYGIDGLRATVAAVEDSGMVNLGSDGDEESFNADGGVYTKVINGVTVAFVSYTCGTGGMSAADYPYAVNILTTDYMTGQSSVDYDRLSADLTKAKDMGADIIVCYLQWWSDANYYTDIREDEKAVVDYLCQNGADIIIGGGVKVPQPIELRKVADGDGYKNCVVAYSLGNLVSCLNDNYTNVSAVLNVELKRDVDNGEVWISHVSYKPIFMLDTGDHGGMAEEPPFKYRLLDLYDAMARYEAVKTGAEDADADSQAEDCITYDVYTAMQDGLQSLQNILGADFDAENGGVDVLAWSETVQMR